MTKVIVVGGGIGGCAAALALHRAGAEVEVYEQSAEFREVGAGINIQGVAIGVLDALGVSVERLCDPARGDGIKTGEIQYYTPEGFFIAEEKVGVAAGATHPQLSMHRAKLHNTLVEACREALGEARLHLDRSFDSLEASENGVSVRFRRRTTGELLEPVHCDLLVGADGLKSRVRTALLGEQRPRYTGRTIFRGLCEVDQLIGTGATVSLCGNHARPGNFICYPIGEGLRRQGKTHCNWAFVAHRPDPGAGENWTSNSTVEDIREEVSAFDGNSFGGLTPLQMAERTEGIIGWALFDREPLESFDFGRVTLLGDAAHPLLPFGSQGATQAIMDAEALGLCLGRCLAEGGDVARSTVKAYSDMRCEITGKIVIANRGMGPTRVLELVEESCQGMSREEKGGWIESHGRAKAEEAIQGYRRAMPKSIARK